MKTKIILTLLSLSLQAHYHDEAREWAQKITHQYTLQELEYIGNLLQAAYERAQATLDIQDAWIKDQELMLQLSHAIADTRRNPHRQQEHTIIPSAQLNDTRSQLIAAYQTYYQANKQYDQLVALFCVTKATHPTRLIQELEIIKKRARFIVARALFTALMELQNSLSMVQEKLWDAASRFKALFFLQKKNPRMIESLMNTFPHMIAQSFATFDDQFTLLQHLSTESVFQSYYFSNHVWRVIEEERKLFYKHYYDALIHEREKQRYAS